MDDKNTATQTVDTVQTEEQRLLAFKQNLARFDPAQLVKNAIDPPSLRNNVMSQIVNLIKYKVSNDEMTEERAKRIADFVLQKMPSNIQYENLMKVIPQLDDQFRELSDVVIPIMVEYEEKIKKEVEKIVEKLIKDGRLDEARSVINTTIEFEKGLN